MLLGWESIQIYNGITAKIVRSKRTRDDCAGELCDREQGLSLQDTDNTKSV